jgi:hypothetical protein
MSIVPREVAERFEKDYYESKGIGFDLIVEGIAQWALEQAAEVCEDQNTWNMDDPGETAARVIRAMMKGGESDGQG